MLGKEAIEQAWEEYSCAESVALERVAFINGYQAALNQIGELLSVIHRDGGHYIEEHGWDKAIRDAVDLSIQRLPEKADE